MNPNIVIWSIVSSLAGFLFGFDTVVISGAEKTIQQLWGLSPGMHGVAIASALYGTVLGAMCGGWPTRSGPYLRQCPRLDRRLSTRARYSERHTA